MGAALLSLGVIPLNASLWWMGLIAIKADKGTFAQLFTVVAVVQFVAGILALVAGIRMRLKTGKAGVGPAIAGGIAALGALAGWVSGAFTFLVFYK